VFSVSLWLTKFITITHHRDTENTEVAQRKPIDYWNYQPPGGIKLFAAIV